MSLHSAWTATLGSNFTVQDVAGSVAAVLAFALLLYGPGYLLAHALDLFSFRSRSFAERSSWALLSSFAVIPVAAYFIVRAAGLATFCWLCAAASLSAAWLTWKNRGAPSHERSLLMPWIVVGWIAFVVISLVEFQLHGKLYFSVILFDQSYRVAFTDAVARTGVPPANPLYFPGAAQPMRYYYFWYVLCAAVMKIAAVSARQAFIASSIWAGFGLAAAIHLFLRYFFGVTAGLRRHVLVALGLLAVTGLDLLPAIGSIFAQPALNGEMEWWSIDQFYSWQDSLLWVPHHTAALLCCMFSFLLLWGTGEKARQRGKYAAVALAALAFASAVGLSVYVAFGFGLLMIAWGIRLCLRRRIQLALAARLCAALLLGTLLLAPFLRELTAQSGTAGYRAHAPAFSLSVRRMIDPEMVTNLPAFAALRASHPALLDLAMRLLLLLPGLALELGFYGVVLWLAARRRTQTPGDEANRTAVFLSACGLILVLFVRSSVISNNDFGYRAALLPQFFLLLLGARFLAGRYLEEEAPSAPLTARQRRLLAVSLVLGVAGTAYQAFMLRAFLPIEAAKQGSGFANLPQDVFQARTAFAELNRLAPRYGVVQFNAVDPTADPNGDVVPPFQFYTRAMLMDSGWQVLNAEPECATAFGGDPGHCAAIRSATNSLYASPAPSAEAALAYCASFGVDYLAATHLDRAWADKQGWVWTLPAAAVQPTFRLLRCGRMVAP